MAHRHKPIKVAIAYDFDGTLSPGNMQEHVFMPTLDIEKDVFWREAKKLAKENDMDEILAYMDLMLRKSNEKKIPIRRSDFNKYGNGISFFPGVEGFFDLINAYGKDIGVKIEHHIISSGLREFVDGTSIAKHFKNIFASAFKYNINGVAEWPAIALNYTNKTQFLFRINKGIHNSFDNTLINKFIPEDDREMPFNRMIYIGDGETDVPAMKMLKYQGGTTIAVFNPKIRKSKMKRSPKEMCQDLIKHNRVDFIAPADYKPESPLVELLKKILQKIVLTEELKRTRNMLMK